MSEAPDPRYAQLTSIGPRKRLAAVTGGVTRKSAAAPPTNGEQDDVGDKARTATPIEVGTEAATPKTTVTASAGERRARSSQPKSTKVAPRPLSESATKLERVPCRVTAELHTRLNAKATETGLSQTGIALRAIEAAHTAGAFTFAAPETGMFLGAAGRRRGPATAKVMLDLRPRTEDLATIEKLMQQHQAPDRTAFIVSALEHFLA